MRVLFTAIALLALAAPAAHARPGDLDRRFSKDGRVGLPTPGAVTGLTFADGLRPVLRFSPVPDDAGPAEWIRMTATGRVAERIAMPTPTKLTLPDPAFVPAVRAVDGAGRTLVGAISLTPPGGSVVARFLPTGALDTTYTVAPPPGIGRVEFIVPNADGSAYVSDGKRLALLDPTGAPQAGFEQGRRFTPNREAEDEARTLVRGPAGTLLAADHGFTLGPWIARILPDGRLDPRFGRGGHVTGGKALRGFNPRAVTYDRHGRVLAAGYTPRDLERDDTVVVRLLPDGRPDRSFGKGGRVTFDLAPVPGVKAWASYPDHVAIDRRGRIVVAGAVYDGEIPPTPYPGVARLRG